MFLLLTFKAFEEKGEAWIVDSDISNDEFNNLKNVAKETGGNGSIPFWIRLFVDGVKYAVTFQIVDDTLEAADSLQELIQKSSEEGNVFVLPEDERLTEGNDGNITTFPAGEFTVPTGTPGFELGEPIGFDDNTFFPKGDGFLDDILNGRFEFPAEDELTFALFDIAGKAGNDLGDIREQAVADLLGVDIVKNSNGQDIRVFEPGASESVSIDVFGPNGELILVGGPNKVTNFSKLGKRLADLKIIANVRGVKAQHYFTDNTDEAVIKFTEKRLGAENVFTFPEVSP